MRKLLIVFFIILPPSIFAQEGWVYLNPTPTAASMFDLTMFTESSGICRSTNSIFRTYNGGLNWIEYNFSNSDLSVKNLSMADSSKGYAYMTSGRLLKTTNGGKNWNFVSQLYLYYTKIKFISESVGYALKFENYIGKIYRTTDGGVSWNETYSESNISLNDLSFVSSNVGFAVGYPWQNPSEHSKILKTTNSGITWDSIPNTLKLSLYRVMFLNENLGFICSNTGLLRTTNGGINWQDTVKYSLIDLKFSNANTGYFLANDTILGRTTNSGANWTISKIRNSTIGFYAPQPTQVYFINQSTGFCIGTFGLNLRTTDNGTTWMNNNSSFTSDELDDVIFKNNNTGFAMGWSPNIYKTTNAGTNWTKYMVGSTATYFGAMAYAGGNTWYAGDFFNDLMYKTTNDGLNWSVSNPGFHQITAMQFINENTGFGVCKYNAFFKTTNGGLNWYINYSIGSQNWNVNFIDENTGYVGGEWKLRKTTNGGATFDTIPESIIYRAWDVKFLSRDTIVVSGKSLDASGFGEIPAIWKSTNSGVTWMPHYLNTSSNQMHGPLRFPNSKTGYVYDGLEYMYKTTDAGDSWFQIKAPDSHVYGMNFLNAETGYAVGDYGMIAKTTDGGASTFINTNESVAKSFSLYQNYPNPFNPSTKIKFDLPQNGNQNNIPVKIIIFDILGRKLETLLDENLTAGVHEVSWNASRYAAGVYFYMLLTDGIKETKKMILIK
ncbi:MAG: T9SS type A sorting domain-containing protein [Bacteroidetes bacterium]|nr:T9SS type A sorting domain-containing protein [Bacteroidota bacterium]